MMAVTGKLQLISEKCFCRTLVNCQRDKTVALRGKKNNKKKLDAPLSKKFLQLCC